MENCIFCKIANKEIGELIYEDDYTVAFKDVNPQAPVHILLIPKKHVKNLKELDDENLMAKLITGVQNVTKQAGITDFRTVINTGEGAGQTVFHLHIHIFAGRKMCWPPC